MVGSDWVFLIGFLACASSVALAADVLIANGPTIRNWLIGAASLVLLAAGLVLALGALPVAASFAVGALLVVGGCYLSVRAYARSNLGKRWYLTDHTPAWLPTVLCLAGFALFIVAIAAGFERAEASVPPVGTIVNATTGQVVEKDVNRTTPQFVQLIGELSACDLSVTPPCRYNRRGEPVRVHIGDVVEFSLRFSDPGTQPVPYFEMYVDKSADLPVAASGRSPNGKRVRMLINWPTRTGRHRESPAETPSVNVLYPQRAKGIYLEYRPGSTVLFDQKGQVLAHLPDGIMEAGIALTDLGAPVSCFCGSKYVRYVNFKVRITDFGRG